MDIYLVIYSKFREIVLTPKTEEEERILNLIKEDSKITVHRGHYLAKSQGGYLKQYNDSRKNSVMLMIEEE